MTPAVLLFAGALLLRLGLVGYGAWQDANFKLKYTDIDYVVFSDAAHFMAQGQSPYLRATYRYTPLLSALLQVNEWHPVAGKFLFLITDLILGYCLYCCLCMLKRSNSPKDSSAILYTALFLFNPVVVNVSTRGNADCLVVALVVGALYCILCGKDLIGAVLYGLSVHVKLYPIVFALALVLHLNAANLPKLSPKPSTGWLRRVSQLLFGRRGLSFAAASATTFWVVTGLCYIWYGWPFLYETYLYHFGRTDNRHNLSPYFYDIYLSLATAGATPSVALKVLAFVPQLLVLVVSSMVTHRDLPLALFLLTYIFVVFNKVCTVQYFVWYMALLPLILAKCQLPWRLAIEAVIVWTGPLLAWFWFAYRLEFQGENTFWKVWVAGLAFFLGNVHVMCLLLRSYDAKRSK